MIVKFATLCDVTINHIESKLSTEFIQCKKRSEEYTAWPTCRVCSNDVCPEHMRLNTKTDADLDTPETCVCINCVED